MNRYVIVGMGVAGISAAETLRSVEPSAHISIISDDQHGYYSRPGLAYYLTGEIPEKSLHPFSQKDWKNLNLNPLLNHRVSRLDVRAHTVEVSDMGAMSYDRLLLATGAKAAVLHVPGEDLDGVVKLDHLEDTRKIISLARKTKTAVVVGGGIVAVELIEGLLALNVHVHYLLRGDRYWSNVFDEAESRLVEKRLENEGVTLHYRTEIKQILGRAGKVSAVQANSGEVIPCKLVAVGVGVRPRMEIAQNAGLKTERGILTNEYMQTSDPDVFAAGDVAQAFDLKTQQSLIDNLWNPGRHQGNLAALNMSGRRTPYYRPVTVNVLKLAGTMIAIIGAVGSGRDDDLVSVARGSSETWLQLPNTLAMVSGNGLNHIRLIIGDRALLGAVIIGDLKLSLPIQEMIDSQTDISPIRNELLIPGAPLGQVLMDFWSTLEEKKAKDAA